MVVRILLWSLGEAKTSLEELRAHLPYLEPPDVWISNEVSERFGLVAYGDELPAEAVAVVRELIGRDPDVGEEFDAEDLP